MRDGCSRAILGEERGHTVHDDCRVRAHRDTAIYQAQRLTETFEILHKASIHPLERCGEARAALIQHSLEADDTEERTNVDDIDTSIGESI